MRKHRLGKQLLIVLCVVLIVFLAGCRPSPVLEQIIYEQQHEIDKDVDTQTMDDDLDNEEPDEDIPPRETEDDSEQEKDQEYTAALAGDMDTDPDTPLDAVYDVVYSPNGELSASAKTNPTEDSTSEKATGSTEAGGEEGGEVPSGEGEDAGNDGASADESDGGMDAGDAQTGGGNGNGDDGMTSGDTNAYTGDDSDRKIVDDDNGGGEEPVTGSRVTAVGEAATIVEMLGTRGQLVGTSGSFYDNFEQQVFASKGASEVPVWWDGDGSSPCSNFDALLEAHPDVCFEISGQETFSDAQIAALNEAGIAYTVIPALTSIANIKEAVTVVGQVLGDDAERIASDYCTWADNMIKMAGGSSTKYTAYIGRWAAKDYWEIYSTAGILATGYGLPVGTKNARTSPLEECFTAANVVNESADGYYVEPLRRLYWGPRIANQTAKFNENVFTIRTPETSDIALGGPDYPAVIVADSDTLQSMVSDQNYFYYHWTPGKQYYTGVTWAFGFDDLIGDGQLVSTYIGGDYDILVNPSGVGSWAGGSVESPLEAVWLSSVFQGNGDVANEVRNFYSTFYGYDGVDTSVIFPSSYYVPTP